jgi:hypothetical protein
MQPVPWGERGLGDDLDGYHLYWAARAELLHRAAPKTRTLGSAAVVEGHLVAVGVRERESAAERPVDGR